MSQSCEILQHIDQHLSDTGMQDPIKRCNSAPFPKSMAYMARLLVLINGHRYHESVFLHTVDQCLITHTIAYSTYSWEGIDQCLITYHENILLHPSSHPFPRRSTDASPAMGIWSWWNAWWRRAKVWRSPRRRDALGQWLGWSQKGAQHVMVIYI